MSELPNSDMDAIVESYDRQDISAINSSVRSMLMVMGIS